MAGSEQGPTDDAPRRLRIAAAKGLLLPSGDGPGR
jgi:hypothetical protein